MDRNGHSAGKTKKTKKDVYYYHIMCGMPEHDAKILVTVKRRAKFLDSGLNLGFTKIGVSTFIGLVPA